MNWAMGIIKCLQAERQTNNLLRFYITYPAVCVTVQPYARFSGRDIAKLRLQVASDGHLGK